LGSSIRGRFPSLAQTDGDAPVIFFDNPAGTQIAAPALQGYSRYLQQDNANVGGAFATSRATDELIDEARAASADFLGAASPQEIIFGPNMTTLTFHFAHAFGRTLRSGDEIVTTRLEHDANVSPWLMLQDRYGAVVRFVDIRPRHY
jgi:selenocysteine lyase/cysteine desulfurase